MPKTILAVDDALTIRKMVSFTLKSAGYDVVDAADGVLALSEIQARPIDMVISDVNMPNMDGYELTRRIRALPGHAKTPIILLTTESDPESKNRGRQAGATGWIVKPFKQEQLVALAARVLPGAVAAKP